MNINFTFETEQASFSADTAIACVYKDKRMSKSAETLDKDSNGQVAAYLEQHSTFKGKKGQVLVISAPKPSTYKRYILLGLGDATELDALGCETAGGNLFSALKSSGTENAVLFIDDDQTREKVDSAQSAAHVCAGIKLRSYKFDKYKTEKDDDGEKENAGLTNICSVLSSAEQAKQTFESLDATVEGTFLARDLMHEPPNMLYPESFAEKIKEDLKPLGVDVEIIDHKKMEKLGMGAALAVGKGSERPPCMVVMHWDGTGSKAKDKPAPLAFVGKGVTFDTGGISIKPSASMDEMKMDMGGAAAVSGLMKALAMRKANVDVIGIIGLAENMPSHNAYRPGDVITSMSGKTIEVLNTDAEGRLVLADALTYVQQTYNPKFVIDLATLTGAIIVALGMEYSGAFVNTDEMWSGLESASKETGEKLWRMPLDEAYRKMMDGNIADMNNLGNEGRWGGACTAAGFLERFVDEDRPWAHLDIAGTMIWKKDKPTVPKGPVGFGVRVLNKFIADHYEAA